MKGAFLLKQRQFYKKSHQTDGKNQRSFITETKTFVFLKILIYKKSHTIYIRV